MRSVRHCFAMTPRISKVLAALIGPVPLAIYYAAIGSMYTPLNFGTVVGAYLMGHISFWLSLGVLGVVRRVASSMVARNLYASLWVASLITAILFAVPIVLIYGGVTWQTMVRDLFTQAFAGFAALIVFRVMIALPSADPNAGSNA